MPSCDIFCRVIDNYGDAGIAWRLAQSLQREALFCVRLIIDDLATLNKLVPQIDPRLTVQTAEKICITRWDADFEKNAEPADCVIEAFSCFLPPAYEKRIADRVNAGKRVSVVALDYLCAEPFAEDFHGLPSPHPKYGYPKTFFFPGFSQKTGGLFIESDYEEKRNRFTANQRAELLHQLGADPNAPFTIFLFTYPTTDTAGLAKNLAATGLPAQILLAPGLAQENFERSIRLSGSSKLRCVSLPMVPQAQFDDLLACADFLIVRGEDSASRAALSGKPFLWTLYPQKENVHLRKMRAFEKTLVDSFRTRSLSLRNHLETALNSGEALSCDDLTTFFLDFEEQKKAARLYAEKCLLLPRVTPNIAKMLLNGLE